MSDFDANPFADPFKDASVTQAQSESKKPSLEDFNPFADDGNAASQSAPAVVVPSSGPPPYKNYGSESAENLSAPPVAAPAPVPVVPGQDELLRRQDELERKAEELERKESEMKNQHYAISRTNNWPPLPSWCPIGPCFFQDFDLDIPSEFRRTVKMLYYLWIFYVMITFNNLIVSLVIFIGSGANSNAGPQFGLALLWFIVFCPCSLCWYRPVYKAFRSDSSFNFFLFFFMMFFQFCFGVIMAVGIPGAGWIGWIVTVSTAFSISYGVGIYAAIQSSLYTIMAVFCLILLKKVHSIYRSTGASFEQAQREFATGALTNPQVQQAAVAGASAAMQTSVKEYAR